MEIGTDMFRNVYAEELYAGELIAETVAPIAAGVKVQAAIGKLPNDLIASHKADGMTILWQHDDYVFMVRDEAIGAKYANTRDCQHDSIRVATSE